MPPQDSFVSWKEYVDERLRAMEQTLLRSQDALNARIESVNHFREEMRHQAGSFITRAEHDALINRLDTNLVDLRKSRDEMSGKASQGSFYFSTFIAVASLIVALLHLITSAPK